MVSGTNAGGSPDLEAGQLSSATGTATSASATKSGAASANGDGVLGVIIGSLAALIL